MRRFGGLAFVALGIAIVLMLPRHQSAQAQQHSFGPAVAETITAPVAPPNPLHSTGPRVAQTATGFPAQTYEVVRPRFNSQTGQTDRVVTSVFAPAKTIGGLATFTARPKLSKETRVLVNELQELAKGENNEDQKEELMQTLREQLDKEFSMMHQQQSDQIATVEKQLEKLKARHEKRTDNKQAIIDRRIDQLLGRPDDLSWEQPGSQLGSTSRQTFVFPQGEWNRAPSNQVGQGIRAGGFFNKPAAPPQPVKPQTPEVSEQTTEVGSNLDLSTLRTAMQAMRESAQKKAALEAALAQVKQLEAMRKRNLVSKDELQKAEMQLAAAQEQAKLSELFLKALGGRMERNVSAEQKKLELEKSQVDQALDAQKLKAVEQKILASEAKLESATSELKLYQEALKVLAKEKAKAEKDE